MNPDPSNAVELLERKARATRRAFAGGVAATGFFALCCAGLVGFVGVAMGSAALASFGTGETGAALFYVLLLVAVGFTYYAWRQRQECACALEEARRPDTPLHEGQHGDDQA